MGDPSSRLDTRLW